MPDFETTENSCSLAAFRCREAEVAIEGVGIALSRIRQEIERDLLPRGSDPCQGHAG